MNRLSITCIVTLLLALNPVLAQADLFDDAVSALTNDNLDAASLDHLGQSLRGGLVAGYPRYTPGPTPLHGFEISTPCGSFSFGQGLIDNLAGMLDPTAIIAGIQQTAMNLLGAAISQLPMVGLCYAAPTMCDIVKYLQDLINELIQFKALSCQQAETLLTGLGGRFRKHAETQCLGKKMAGGMTMERAQIACSTSASDMRQAITDHATGKPIGDSGSDGSSKLIEDTLTRADAPQEIKDFALALLGEVEIKAGGGGEVDIDIQAPAKRLHDEYEIEIDQMISEIEDCVNIVEAGNPLVYDKRRNVSLPGMAMPDAVLKGLADIRAHDPAAYVQYAGKLAGNLVMLRLSWKIHETRDLLEEGTIDNTRLSEAELEIMQARLNRLMRESDRFISEKALAERHLLPIMQEIVADRRERQIAAFEATLSADVDSSAAANRFGVNCPWATDTDGGRGREEPEALRSGRARRSLPAASGFGAGCGVHHADPGRVGLPVQRPGHAGAPQELEPQAAAAGDHGVLHHLAGVPARHLAASAAPCRHRCLPRQLRPHHRAFLAGGSAALLYDNAEAGDAVRGGIVHIETGRHGGEGQRP